MGRAGRRGVRAASAVAGAGAVVLWLLRSCDAAVQEHFPAVVDIQTSGLDIAVRRCLGAHGLELIFHLSDREQGKAQTADQRHEDPAVRHRFPRKIASVVRFILSRLCDKGVALIDKGVKGTCKIAVGKIRHDLFAYVLNTGVCKCRNAVAAGGDPPVVVLHADEEKQTVASGAIAEIAVVVQIVRVLHNAAAL